MPTDIILYALIAAGLVLWLRSLLGTRHGEERDRPNPFITPVEKTAPVRSGDATLDPSAAMLEMMPDQAPLPKNFHVTALVEEQVANIARADRTFDLSHFANGAGDAFAYVVEAFADGDRAALKDLLAPKVYKVFDAALSEREKTGETIKTEIHSVRKTDLLDASLKDKMIYLKVRFTADETCVIRDKDNTITSGDPDRVTEMVDVWTFGREIKSKDPRWLVYETSDGDVIEDHKTPIPDAH